MGTEIQLKVGSVSLDYAKNHMGNDYGFLFQVGDESRCLSDSIDYKYYEEHPDEKDLAEHEATFIRTLARTTPRLALLGYTLETARTEYEATVREASELLDDFDHPNSMPPFATFDEFCLLACLFPLSTLASEYIDFDTVERGAIAQGRYAFHIELFDRIPMTDNSDMYWSESSYLSARLCILSAASMLLIFNLNVENALAEVTWQFGPIVNAGWVNRESFKPGVRRKQKILLATEGASDVRILRRALDLLRPDIADFFHFVDADERHHFWSASNLVKFAEGLLRIDVQNQILFLLDNDVEGVEAYRKLQQLNLLGNMRAMLLPDIEEFRNFPARGPQGTSNCDINGRAVAIECYLDLSITPSAQVVWSNFKRELNVWHGALEYKEAYMRHFMDQDVESFTNSKYDISKLVKLLDALVAEASSLSASSRIAVNLQ